MNNVHVNEIVYIPFYNGYIRYKIKKVFDDSVLALTYKSGVANWLMINELMDTDTFTKIYNNEPIYE